MSQTLGLPKTKKGPEKEGENKDRPVSLQDYSQDPGFDQVKEYVTAGDKTEWSKIYEPLDVELTSHSHHASETTNKTIWTDPTYLSFGDGGTTATVTEWGKQMQFSRYLGHGASGIYTIDCESTPEPNMPEKRSQSLLKMVDNNEGFGPDTNLPEYGWQQTTYWLRNRWPRVIFESPGRWRLALQWVVQDNVIIQQLVLRNFTDETIIVDYTIMLNMLIRELNFVNSSHSFNSDKSASNKNNEENGENNTKGEANQDAQTQINYTEGPGPGGYGFVKLHRLPKQDDQGNDTDAASSLHSSEKNLNPDAVAAVMGVFINGEAWTKDKFDKNHEVKIEPEEVYHLVAGYKLVLLSTERQDWEPLVLTREDVNIDGFLCKTRLEDDIPLDTFLYNEPFYIGRNVEHILTVCAIPVTEGPAWDYNTKPAQDMGQEDKPQMMALTCGDMAGHRVNTSASYFAFKFLLEVCRSLRDSHPLRNRIKQTCLAHLRWVFNLVERKEHIFCRYYWVTGQAIQRTPQLLPDALTDTPFQILKACAFFQFLENPTDVKSTNEKTLSTKIDEPISLSNPATETGLAGATNEAEARASKPSTEMAQANQLNAQRDLARSERENEKAEVRDFLNKRNGNIAMRWVEVLDKTNKRDAYAWPHSNRAGMNYFRLDDHIWIWNAIKAISIILNWDEIVKNDSRNRRKTKRRAGDTEEWSVEMIALMRKYTPAKVKREIISRFTAVHDVSKERMLAVTRSPRETRFEFHSRDTTLFYQIMDDEMMLEKKDERWSSLIKIQKRFTSFQDTESSDNPLRHGLKMLSDPSSIMREEKELQKDFLDPQRTIKMSMLSNGLFPGQISNNGEAERSIYHHDHLLHVSFEIPYLLYTTKLEQGPITKNQDTEESQTSNKAKDDEALTNTRILNGTIPFNDQIDVKSIIDVKEEWLYNYPSFFEWTADRMDRSLWVLELDSHIRHLESLLLESFGRSKKDEEGEEGEQKGTDDETLVRAFEAWKRRSRPPSKQYQPAPNAGPMGHEHLLIDIGKKRSRTKKIAITKDREFHSSDLASSWSQLYKLRTAENAKKRFMWCQNSSVDYALMCYIASPANEQPSLRLFFDRHFSCTTDFEDRANRVYNTWETEFHCSFLRLVRPPESPESQETPGLVNKGGDIREDPDKTQKETNIIGAKLTLDQQLPQLDGQQLQQASASFKFYGDFFDRFWTCHYLESYLGKTPQSNMKDHLGKDSKELKKIFKDAGGYVWQQRRILEPLLFHLILSEINFSTQTIIRTIRGKLNVTGDFNTKMGFNTQVYFDSLKTWAELHVILEFLGEKLDTICDNIKNWNSREQNRRTEKPRWTNNDEKKYRDAINQIFLECQRDERGLLANRASVLSLEKTLNYHRNEAKNDYGRYMSERTFNQNNNVKYFTYSTVIFLPLGFAASIYSMQAAPPTDVLQNMVICSVVAFFVLLIIISILPLILKGLYLLQKYLQRLSKKLQRLYSDSKELYGFWKLFYTRVPFSVSDLLTMQLPSYVILLSGQSINQSPQLVEYHKVQPAQSEHALGDITSKSLKGKTRDELEFTKARGELWVQSWNRIIGPWNESIGENRRKNSSLSLFDQTRHLEDTV